jgi:hypothetical protein
VADELVVRVVLRNGADRDQFASAITAALGTNPGIEMVTNPGIEMVTVDLGESGPMGADETRSITTTSGGLQLEETRRLYVRFGPRPDERLRLARQQFSMLGMLMNTPTVRGTKKLMERLRAWDPYTWSEVPPGSATKVYSRLTEALDELARRSRAAGIYRLTKAKGVYGFSAVIPETRKGR